MPTTKYVKPFTKIATRTMKYVPKVFSLPSVASRKIEDGHKTSINRNAGYGKYSPESISTMKNTEATAMPIIEKVLVHFQKDSFMSTFHMRDTCAKTGCQVAADPPQSLGGSEFRPKTKGRWVVRNRECSK